MNPPAPSAPSTPSASDRLFTYDFVVLILAAGFAFCNIAVFYGLATYLERIGIDPAWRGAVIGAEPLAAFVARPFLSVWLTARQALAVARLSLVGLGLALPCYMFATNLPAVFAVRIFHGLSFVCLVSAVMVLLTRVIPPKQAGRAFGLFSLSSLVPFAIMPPLTEWLLGCVGTEARAYAWTALLTLPSLTLLVPLGKRLGRSAFSGELLQHPSWRAIGENMKQTPVFLLLGASLLLFVSTTQVFYFIKPSCLSLGLAEPGLFFTISSLASIAARVFGGPFYDRLPRRGAAMAALAVLSACMALFGVTTSDAVFFILAAAYGLLLGVALPLLNAAMFLDSPPHLRGMNMNLMLFMMDAGYTLGPITGGALLSAGDGFGTLFAVSAGCTVGAAALMAPLAAREWRQWGRPEQPAG